MRETNNVIKPKVRWASNQPKKCIWATRKVACTWFENLIFLFQKAEPVGGRDPHRVGQSTEGIDIEHGAGRCIRPWRSIHNKTLSIQHFSSLTTLHCIHCIMCWVVYTALKISTKQDSQYTTLQFTYNSSLYTLYHVLGGVYGPEDQYKTRLSVYNTSVHLQLFIVYIVSCVGWCIRPWRSVQNKTLSIQHFSSLTTLHCI